jgi:hypothetical protein
MDSSLLIALALASVASIGLLFLPAIIELKKPSDQGPRSIGDGDTYLRNRLKSLEKQEEKPKVDCQVVSFSKIYGCIEEDASLLEE